MTVFNATQKICAKILYNMISQLDGAERVGALKALSVLGPMVEDGFVTLNSGELRSDFFVQCFDVLLSVNLSMKMLEDDGLVPNELTQIQPRKIVKVLDDAEAAYCRVEEKLKLSPRPSTTDH